MTAISADRVKKFYWRICRFGIPRSIVLDNGTQFASKAVEDFCKGLNIQQVFSSVEHPQTNGQAEAANKVVLMGLKKGWTQLKEDGQSSYLKFCGPTTLRLIPLQVKHLLS